MKVSRFLILNLILIFNCFAAEEAAFLRAIAADPGNDTPRLAYADWLDEHDRAAQAEYIRLEIAIARNPDDENIVTKKNRSEELFKKHCREWVPAGLYDRLIPPSTGDTEQFGQRKDLEWERGLPSRVHLHRDNIGDPETIRLLNQMTFVSAVDFAYTPWGLDDTLEKLKAVKSLLSKARTIRIGGNVTSDQLVKALELLPAVPHLFVSHFTDGLREAHIRAILESHLAPTLESLELGGITPDGLRTLSSSQQLPKLRALAVRKIASQAHLPLALVAGSGLPALEELHFDVATPNARELAAFASTPRFASLKYLRLNRPKGNDSEQIEAAIRAWKDRPHRLISLMIGRHPLDAGTFPELAAQIATNRTNHPDPNCLLFVAKVSER